ncbi:MAG: hypothetical protein ACRC0Y_03165 [Fusobacteriaceae bacterium]
MTRKSLAFVMTSLITLIGEEQLYEISLTNYGILFKPKARRLFMIT